MRPEPTPQRKTTDAADKRPRVLCVDDEPRVLESLSGLLGRRFEVVGANSAAEALRIVQDQEPFAVVLSDMLMPDTDGAAFLERVQEVSADSVRLLLTGRSDLDTAIRAVNRGRIFRFLTKPCPPNELYGAVTAAAEQYRLITSERELLEQTLRGSINVLTEMLALTNPLAFSRAQRVRRLVRQMLPHFDKEQAWELDVTAMLSQIGLVTVPGEVLEKVDHGLTLTSAERSVYQRYPQVGKDIIGRIPRLETVAESIGLQHTRMDEHRSNGSGRPLPLGARILKAVIDFEERAAAGLDARAVLREMQARRGWYDPEVLEALGKAVKHLGQSVVAREVPIAELISGMILNQAVKTDKGMLLFEKGQEITFPHLLRLINFSKFEKIREPISVLVPSNLRARMAR
jgi:response regulator RpfG family c-di-GMP phosphodiesterase